MKAQAGMTRRANIIHMVCSLIVERNMYDTGSFWVCTRIKKFVFFFILKMRAFDES